MVRTPHKRIRQGLSGTLIKSHVEAVLYMRVFIMASAEVAAVSSRVEFSLQQDGLLGLTRPFTHPLLDPSMELCTRFNSPRPGMREAN